MTKEEHLQKQINVTYNGLTLLIEYMASQSNQVISHSMRQWLKDYSLQMDMVDNEYKEKGIKDDVTGDLGSIPSTASRLT